jgi:hypothetical protein
MSEGSPIRVRDAIRGAGRFGPFFAVSTVAGGATWTSMTQLVEDPDTLVDRINATRAALAASIGVPVADVEPRVAASLAHLNLVARVLSLGWACAVAYSVVPDLSLANLRWEAVLGGPAPLALVTWRGERGEGINELADLFASKVIDPAVQPLTSAVLELSGSKLGPEGGVSAQVLLGNVASALVSATRMVADGSPKHAKAGSQLLAHVLDHPYLTGTFDTRSWQRQSCCLYYRAFQTLTPPVARDSLICGDCVLRA